MNETSSIKVTSDAYYALKSLKKSFKEKYGRTYSISDLIIVGAILATELLENNPSPVVNLAEMTKLLRLKKNRGEYESNIFETLKNEHLGQLCNKGTSSKDYEETIAKIIEMLIDEKYPEAATLILFEYKNHLDEHTFKELAGKIVNVQAQILKTKNKTKETVS